MATYVIDAAHSEIQFKVKHLMISTVTGNFTRFDATMQAEDDAFLNASISFEADVNSIQTGNEQRDGHLKSADFFDAENHPKISFASSSFVSKGDNHYSLEGTLTIRGNSKKVVLDVEYLGKMVDFYGNEKHGFELNGKINRKDFGLEWSAVTEAGGIVVSDEVRLHMNVQMQKVN
ncbi:MAG: YceI family protein [Flavobacteriales bacterium]|nr:YceI family protein [Flavobacteriales bacterium]